MDGVEAWSHTVTTEQCLAALNEAGVPSSAYRTVAAGARRSAARPSPALVDVEDGGGTFRVMNLPFRMSGAKVAAGKRVSTLGEHTRALLKETGLSDDQIAAFSGRPLVAQRRLTTALPLASILANVRRTRQRSEKTDARPLEEQPEISRGETLGLVGESGCGKSTLGRAVLQLRPAVSGRVVFDSEDLTSMRGEALRKMRRLVQPHFPGPDRLAQSAAVPELRPVGPRQYAACHHPPT